MDELEENIESIKRIVKTRDDQIKSISKELYNKNGELSRVSALWEKEKLISSEFEKKFKKLNEMFKGVK